MLSIQVGGPVLFNLFDYNSNITGSVLLSVYIHIHVSVYVAMWILV